MDFRRKYGEHTTPNNNKIIIITCAFRINANGSFTCCCGLSDNEDIGKLVKNSKTQY